MTQSDINIHVGNRIKHLRESRGDTQEDMQERTGIDDSRLSRLESGKQKITVIELDIFKVCYGLKGWGYFTEGLRGY